MFGGQEGKKGAKKALDATSGTARRQEQMVSIRKNKKNELLEKNRRKGDVEVPAHEEAAAAGAIPSCTGDPNDPWSYHLQSNPAVVPLALLPRFMEMILQPDDRQVYQGTLLIRKLLSVESNPPIDEVIATGCVPYLVRFMERADFMELQFEACWALTNIASGTREHTHLVISANAVPLFIQLLSSESDDCREQATWAIGNLAGESDKCRDFVLEQGAMAPLLALIMRPTDKITLLRNAVWALSNCCRGKPGPRLELVTPALPVLASLLNHHDDEVVVDAAWAISYISDGPGERIQVVLEAGVLSRIVQLLTAPTTAMQTPAIRTIGNIAAGNDRQTQTIINAGALPAMHFLLEHPKRAIRKETNWTISNITAGHRDQIQAVINANLMPAVLRCTTALELEVKKEAAWAIANATSGGSPEQMRYLVEIGALQALCDLLVLYDPKIVSVALEALQNLLQVGADDQAATGAPRNAYAAIVTDYGGLDHLERLQTHTNVEVYRRALYVLENFFDLDEDDGGAPGAAGPTLGDIGQQGSGFPFGGGAPTSGGGVGGGAPFSF